MALRIIHKHDIIKAKNNGISASSGDLVQKLPHTTRSAAWACTLLFALIVLCARWLLVATYGSSLPFWDQWYAEGTFIYKPLLEGNYDWAQIFSAHNEHRIALTRLFNIALFYLNDMQWDARVQTLANSILFAFGMGLYSYNILRKLPRNDALILCITLILIGILPFGWENLVAGFQNQFYFCFILTLIIIYLASSVDSTPLNIFYLTLVAVLTVFTLATGALALIACVGVIGIRAVTRDLSLRSAIWLMLPLCIVATLAVMRTPSLPEHIPLLAHSFSEFVRVALMAASWPLVSPAWFLFALPTCIVLWITLSKGRLSTADLFFFGLGLWSLLVGAVVAHSRGHEMVQVPSRYLDLLAIGSTAYIYFALRLNPDRASGLCRTLLVTLRIGVPTSIIFGLLFQSIVQFPSMVQRSFLTRLETSNVRSFMEGDASALAGKPLFYIPWQDANELAQILSDPTIRSILPISISLSQKRTPDAIQRPCAWFTLNGEPTSPSVVGHLDCNSPPGSSSHADSFSLGRLSALSYLLWESVGTDPLSAVQEDHNPMQTEGTTARCWLDYINGVDPGPKYRLQSASALRFSGWAGSDQAKPEKRPISIVLTMDDHEYFSVSTHARFQRPDVAAVYRDGGYQWAGFDIFAGGEILSPGDYRVLVREGSSALCDSHRILSITTATDVRLMY